MREKVTRAIVVALLDELAEVGYAGMTMEAVARRAKVGKASLYRRWRGKEEMVETVIAELASEVAPIPDTGTLRGDIAGFVASAGALRSNLRITRIIADLSAEAIRNPHLATVFHANVRTPRREAGFAMLNNAIARGELPSDLDFELALDCLVALTQARPQSLDKQGELSDPYPQERLVDVILVALTACTSPRSSPS